MATTRLLMVTGAIAMLSAAPVFAQTNTETGSAGPHDNTVTTPDGTMSNNGAGPGSGMSTAPRHSMGSSGSGMHTSSMHSRSTTGSSAMRGGRGDSQNAAVEQLNEQSYQAAQRGQNFTGSSGDMGASGGSGMSGGSGGAGMPGGSGSSGGTGAGSQGKM